MKVHVRMFLVAVVLIGGATATHAQYTRLNTGGGFVGGAYGYRSSSAAYYRRSAIGNKAGSSFRSSLRTVASNRRSSNTVPRSTATSRRIGSTTFSPVSTSIVPLEMAATASKTGTERQEMEAFFEQCLQNYEANMRQQGQPIRDVARAVSYFIGVNYNVLHGGNALTANQGSALRAQIKAALEQDETFQRMSNREKQQMYEMMAVMAEFVAVSSDVAAQKGNKQLADMARDMAKDNLEKLLGTSVNNIRITDHGLEF